jgi:hypothetical protein
MQSLKTQLRCASSSPISATPRAGQGGPSWRLRPLLMTCSSSSVVRPSIYTAGRWRAQARTTASRTPRITSRPITPSRLRRRHRGARRQMRGGENGHLIPRPRIGITPSSQDSRGQPSLSLCLSCARVQIEHAIHLDPTGHFPQITQSRVEPWPPLPFPFSSISPDRAWFAMRSCAAGAPLPRSVVGSGSRRDGVLEVWRGLGWDR